MGFFSTMRGLLPASSRSFHGMWQDIPRRIESSEVSTHRYIDWKIDDLVVRRLESIEGLLKGYTTESLNLQWQMYMQPGESLDDARKRFYGQMPPATGSLRLLQKANAKLLLEFDELCRENGVKYFLCAGTLLGAKRHGGSIPWDDDADVGIEQGQLAKLLSCMNSQNRYRITIVYDLNVFCKQIRFRWADETLPCFVDLFVYEYASLDDVSGMKRYQELRASVVEEMDAIAQAGERRQKFIYEGDINYETCERIVDKVRDAAVESGLICGVDDAKAMMWGLENLTTLVGAPPLYPLSWFEPLGEAEYEGMSLPAPADAEAYLEATYGDWMGMPKSRAGDIVHAKGSAYTPESVEAMRQRVND